MPELPEVETIRRGLEKALKGRVIAGVELARDGLRHPFPPALGRLKNAAVTGLSRRAKYLLIFLGPAGTMIVHLGMSGRLTVEAGKGAPQKHDHMTLRLDNGLRVVLNDARRFGTVDLAAGDGSGHRFFRDLGPEPLDAAFTPAALAEKLAGKKVAVKLAIMDQRVVVGVGNIYAAEALHAARIDPRRAAGSLSPAEVKKLVAAIRKTLESAIAAGGSSLRDYVQADGELGYFQHSWAVYGREGEKCRGCACKTGIRRLTQGGRSTFFCPGKQD